MKTQVLVRSVLRLKLAYVLVEIKFPPNVLLQASELDLGFLGFILTLERAVRSILDLFRPKTPSQFRTLFIDSRTLKS